MSMKGHTMSPMKLTPLPGSVPFDDLAFGGSYLIELRPWVAAYQLVRASFVELVAHPGDPLGVVMLLPGGQFITFWRTQILNISRE
jgi:hypothetical protein